MLLGYGHGGGCDVAPDGASGGRLGEEGLGSGGGIGVRGRGGRCAEGIEVGAESGWLFDGVGGGSERIEVGTEVGGGMDRGSTTRRGMMMASIGVQRTFEGGERLRRGEECGDEEYRENHGCTFFDV